MTAIELSSTAFGDHQMIPRHYSGERDDVSPPLTWSAAPEGAAELVLVCEDPDAPGGTFLHWLVTGIDPGSSGVDDGESPPGGHAWPNDFGRVGWGGPMPPRGTGNTVTFFACMPCPSRSLSTAVRAPTRCIVH